jgi:ZIP family zinc transporter/zinc and cadmium transporter
MDYLWISLALGVVAGLANLFGGAIVTARAWSRTFLTYFIALGSGFMLATALTEMEPASGRRRSAPTDSAGLLHRALLRAFLARAFPLW